jgi:hypothetical protein
MIFEELHTKVNTVINSIDEIISDEVIEHEDFITSSNKSQLWDGKTFKDEDITPLYSQDPFFKTKKQAIGYRNWKQRITPNSRRNPDAPNLFINGFFYSSIEAKKENNEIFIGTNSGFGSEVEAGHKDIFGLTDEHWDGLINLSLDNIKKNIVDEITG